MILPSLQVFLTLWDTTASNFEGAGFPIVAIKGAKVRRCRGLCWNTDWRLLEY